MKSKLLLAIFLLVASLSFAAATADLPFGPWTRASNVPILSPQGASWESAGTFNPTVELVVPMDNFNQPRGSRAIPEIVMLYRAQDASRTSRLGFAESIDGIHFTRRPDPVLSPEADYEKDGGLLPHLHRLQ